MTPAALFLPGDGALLQSTELTRGPWSDVAQHGGPVSALLARAVEAHEGERGLRVVRLTVELLRPVPIAPLRVSAAGAGSGRSADRVSASAHDATTGTLLATASALRIRTKVVAVPPQPVEPPPPGPDGLRPLAAPLGGADRLSFLTHGMELRFARGDFMTPGPAITWFRLRVPVVAGEEPSPLQRVAAAADFGNGISGVADMSRLLFVNPDLTIALHRHPTGPWVCLDSVSRLEPDGIGGAESALSDTQGRIGWAYQTLLVSSRAAEAPP